MKYDYFKNNYSCDHIFIVNEKLINNKFTIYLIDLSENNELWTHLREVGITPCDQNSTIEVDMTDHPSVIRSYSFNCLSLNGIVYRDVYATVDVNGITEINFTGFDSPGHVDLNDVLLHMDELEGALTERLRSFTDNNFDLV